MFPHSSHSNSSPEHKEKKVSAVEHFHNPYIAKIKALYYKAHSMMTKESGAQGSAVDNIESHDVENTSKDDGILFPTYEELLADQRRRLAILKEFLEIALRNADSPEEAMGMRENFRRAVQNRGLMHLYMLDQKTMAEIDAEKVER